MPFRNPYGWNIRVVKETKKVREQYVEIIETGESESKKKWSREEN